VLGTMHSQPAQEPMTPWEPPEKEEMTPRMVIQTDPCTQGDMHTPAYQDIDIRTDQRTQTDIETNGCHGTGQVPEDSFHTGRNSPPETHILTHDCQTHTDTDSDTEYPVQCTVT
jgi:hypothetical protein